MSSAAAGRGPTLRWSEVLADRSRLFIRREIAGGRIGRRIEFCVEQFLDSLDRCGRVVPSMLVYSIRHMSSEVGQCDSPVPGVVPSGWPKAANKTTVRNPGAHDLLRRRIREDLAGNNQFRWTLTQSKSHGLSANGPPISCGRRRRPSASSAC